MALTDDSIFPYGKYKKEGLTMEQVPAWYLLNQRNWIDGLKDVIPNSSLDQVRNYVIDNEEILISEKAH